MRLRAMLVRLRHYGPGPHRSGTPQSVHGRGGMARFKAAEKAAGRRYEPPRRGARRPRPAAAVGLKGYDRRAEPPRPKPVEPPPGQAAEVEVNKPRPPMSEAEADRWIRLSSAGEENLRAVAKAFVEMGFDATAPLHLRNAFEFLDAESGLNTQVDKLNIRQERTGIYSVYLIGSIFNAAGDKVGRFERNFQRGGDVHHEYFKLDDDVQGNGFGSRFYQMGEEAYRQMGVKSISLYANISVGGYAWARMGFDFRDADTLSDMRSAFTEHLFSAGVRDAAVHAAAGNIQHAWEMAAFTGPNGERWGKEFLLGKRNNWNGVKMLSEAEEGYQIGKAYFDKKGKR